MEGMKITSLYSLGELPNNLEHVCARKGKGRHTRKRGVRGRM